MRRQRIISLGKELEECYLLPFVLVKTLTRLFEILESDSELAEDRLERLSVPEVSETFEIEVEKIKTRLNLGEWQCLSEVTNCSVLVELLYEWLECSVIELFSLDSIDKLGKFDWFSQKIEEYRESSELEGDIPYFMIKDTVSVLSLAEREILLYLESFYDNLTDLVGNKARYKAFKQRITAHLLGFSYEEYCDNSRREALEHYFRVMELVSFILRQENTVVSRELTQGSLKISLKLSRIH